MRELAFLVVFPCFDLIIYGKLRLFELPTNSPHKESDGDYALKDSVGFATNVSSTMTYSSFIGMNLPDLFA